VKSERRLPLWLARTTSVLAIGLSCFQLYVCIGALTPQVLRSIHVAAILALAFVLHGKRLWLDLSLALLSVSSCLYFAVFLDDIVARQGDWRDVDILVGVVGILLVLEACRRVIGWFMAAICAAFLLYAYFGPWMPELFAHKGYNIERIATTLWLTTEGVFGVPIYVASTFVFVFVLFGAFLEVSGGGNFFINLAYALTGRFAGGPAKTSVIASGFMGSVSGSAVANVVATGSFTIPMMKRVGYKPHVAGAIEAAASTGGQLMPPIMGAGAFLMAEFTDTSYLTIIKIAIVPALLYYLTVLTFVHFEAKKRGLEGLPKEMLPRAGAVLKDGLHFVLPVAVLVTVLVLNFPPMAAGLAAVVSVFLASLLRTKTRMGPRKVVRGLERGARNAVMVSVACAAAGIIVGVVGLTGQGLNFSSLVLKLSMDVQLLAILLIAVASLVLGMGLPVTASYIVLATLAGPALLKLGIPLLVTHMIVFWYSQDANVTPPVSLASFAGAGVAGAHPMRTAFTSWKLAKGLYIIPIVMAYRPLLGNGPAWEVALTMVTCGAGLVAFAAALDRFFFRPATWLETGLFAVAALALFWPEPWWTDAAGAALFVAALVKQSASPG
jgi:TRAP transporter 4TM/12TM fusion protein